MNLGIDDLAPIGLGSGLARARRQQCAGAKSAGDKSADDEIASGRHGSLSLKLPVTAFIRRRRLATRLCDCPAAGHNVF
ncbi:MAG: hypothetical protein QOJ15_10653 [Bradyrhizobium sp.]|nr:hypothetical protein [Bradyrhizobium sp.]